MIKSVEVINNFGESLTIDLGSPETSGLWIKSIKGIGPGKADINTTDLASSDGGIYNSARSDIRNITMTLGFMPYVDETGEAWSVEDTRRYTYKWFAKKRPIDFIVHTDRISLVAYGYVESNEPDMFQKDETTAISIICPDPNMYIYGGSEGINFSSTDDIFEFPVEDEYYFYERDTVSDYLTDKVNINNQMVNLYEFTPERSDPDFAKYYQQYKSFKKTEDSSLISGKTYYEIIDGRYCITTDTHKLLGKKYYELDGYENPVDVEYVLTEDIEPNPGKEYFKKIGNDYVSLGDEYVVTSDTTMDDTKTYYELVSGEYVITEDLSFVSGKTYYELINYIDLSALPENTYEYQSVTEFGHLITIASKSTYYDGEIEIGLNFIIYINGEVSGLKLYKIYDAYNYDTIEIDDGAIQVATGGPLNAGDEIHICTIRGQKNAVLIREAAVYNIMNALGRNPDWFQLDQGENTFSYGTDNGSEYVSIHINYVKAYEGV